MCWSVFNHEGLIMRISAIQSGSISLPKKNLKMSGSRTTNLLAGDPQSDTVSFKSKAVKGGILGAGIGLLCMGAISALSGGLAAPIAYAAYAGVFGTAGAMAGKATDDLDKKKDKED